MIVSNLDPDDREQVVAGWNETFGNTQGELVSVELVNGDRLEFAFASTVVDNLSHVVGLKLGYRREGPQHAVRMVRNTASDIPSEEYRSMGQSAGRGAREWLEFKHEKALSNKEKQS